jgi:(1->4)-alpha-D-glucan 1-alpha-D-glucosylmutase
VFERGRYDPLQTLGAQAERVIAFERTIEKKSFLAVASRFLVALGSRERLPVGEATWTGGRVWLPHGRGDRSYRDVFTGKIIRSDGGSLPLPAVFAELPIALLESSPAQP